MTEKKDLLMQETKDEKEQKLKEQNIRKLILKYLRKLGIPCNLIGYQYVSEAIYRCVVEPEKINMVVKALYYELAEFYQTTPSRVERGIRHAIEVGAERGDLNFMEEMFGFTISSLKGKPTNSEFIGQVAEDIRINNQF